MGSYTTASQGQNTGKCLTSLVLFGWGSQYLAWTSPHVLSINILWNYDSTHWNYRWIDVIAANSSPTRVLLPTLESMESKRYTSYGSYSTNVYIENTEVQHLHYWERLRELKLYSLQSRSERYIIIYIWKITQHDAKYWCHDVAQNKNQKTPKTWSTVHYSVSN